MEEEENGDEGLMFKPFYKLKMSVLLITMGHLRI